MGAQGRSWFSRQLVTAALVAVAGVCAACGGSGSGGGPTVPSVTGSGGTAAAGHSSGSSSGGQGDKGDPPPRVGYSQQRLAQMRAASQCVRAHGVPDYQDAVLTSDGHVYTDARTVEVAISNDPAIEAALRQSCAQLFTAAGFTPEDQSPAPPALVQAGVKSARCLRANGLPAMRDPDSSTRFTPGHGFGLSSDELPNGGRAGKQDPTVQHAFGACRPVLDAEIQASTLTALAHD